jgi:hypothetical protein
MPGGPINGVPWLAAAGSAGIPGGAAVASAARRGADPNDAVNTTGIVVPTVIQMATDALEYWNNLTCFYDRHWTPDPDKVTLPICTFSVTDISPIYSVETSKKRVLVYEQKESESAVDMAKPMRNNSMRAIIDNSVKQPTIYNMEIIVPFQPVGRYMTEGIKTISDMVAAMSDLLGSGLPGGFTDWWEGLFSSVFSQIKTVGQAAESASKLPNMNDASFINMNSLEAMAESCRTLCMKMWTGYQYKYVQITNMTSKKKGIEDDVFRVSLTLQEIPVLTLSPPKVKKPSVISRNWAVTAISSAQGALISPLIAMTGVREAAGEGKSGAGMIREVLGG